MEGKEVNMSSEIFGVMTILACNSCYPMDKKSMRRAKKLLEEYVKDPDVNRVRCMLVEDLQLAPLHWAIILGSLELLEIFLQSSRDGKSVKNSTDTNFGPKISTKSAYSATYCNLSQNSVIALCYWN